MKCALCGAEWKTEGELGGQRHAERRCPLNGIALYQPQVEAINDALKAVKKDTRKPEECGYMENDGDRKICGLHMIYVDIKRICPCASWTKA